MPNPDWPCRCPEPPYYVVAFTSLRTGQDPEGYARAAAEMDALARAHPGFLGIESVRSPEGAGITLSYWATARDVLAWKAVAAHVAAQRAGRERWYADYAVRVARVERAYTRESSPRSEL